MAVKHKVSKVKRNNHKRNKLIKRGVIKKKSPQTKKSEPKTDVKPRNEPQIEEESDAGEDMLEMVEESDLKFLKTAITNKSYNIYNKVKYSGSIKKNRKRKFEENEQLENEYENQSVDNVKMKPLLPIKTKKGIVPQEKVDNEIEAEIEQNENFETESNGEESEIGEYTLLESEFDFTQPLSAAQLLATRNDVLRQRKLHIGTLSSGVLENPEEKITNLRTLLKIIDDNTPEVYFTVRKLVIVSLLEVFKEILPSYEIKNISTDGVKLKKETLRLQKFESNLLAYYKQFLQKLEKFCFFLVKKKGSTVIRSEEEKKIGELSVKAMCDLLVEHSYFNYSQNIVQVLVPFLNHPNKNIREIVKNSIKTVFKEDKKEEITLKILRLVNQYLKNHAHNVHTDMLEILLVLNLKDVNLDQDKEQELKQKKLMANKSRVLQLSKKERKKKKKLKQLEQELLETKAEENKQAKQKNLTEITKIIFNIYFRILKNSSNTKILGICLEGLAKFAHCINIEYYIDLVNVLDKILKEEWTGYREKLHCIQTVFAILSGQGEALNIDPTRFYVYLYKDLLTTHASKNHNDFLIVLKTLNDALVKRRKKITSKRTIGFVKRIATLTLQLLHNGSLGGLSIVRNIMQLNRSVDILLDFDSTSGDGKFQAELADAEYANASSTALYEMVALVKHYHPIVGKFALNIIGGANATNGECGLSPQFGLCRPEKLFEDFSMCDMAFNPAVPIPKNVKPKLGRKRNFCDDSFEDYCKNLMKSHIKNFGGFLPM